MLKFASVLAFVIVVVSVALALLSLGVDAKTPKWHQITPSYSYRQYLADSNKKAPIDPLEFSMREQIFVSNLKDIISHNSQPGKLYKKGINQFADWTVEEKKQANGAKVMELAATRREIQQKPYHSFHTLKSSSPNLPRSWDWRNIGNGAYLTATKNQGMCGSCWGFASTEVMESHYALATDELFVQSPQQLVSCAPNPTDCGGDGGCGGSIAELAYQYIIENGGQTEEWQYPYTAFYGTSGKCDIPAKSNRVAKFTGFKTVESNNQLAVMDALMVGPLAINVDASTWHTYSSGIFDGCDYSKNITIDHVVNLVGYGTDPVLNQDYWTVRNSWSASFGEGGYIRLLKTDTPQCGTNYPAQDGVACKGQPITEYACGECGLLFSVTYPVATVTDKKN